MDESRHVIGAAQNIANALASRDVDAIVGLLARGFLHRTPGGETHDADTFANGIKEIPGDILFVRLDNLEVDLSGEGALVTGIQHAHLRIDGEAVDDRRAFVDWFVKQDGEWSLRVAVDLPTAQEPGAGPRA